MDIEKRQTPRVSSPLPPGAWTSLPSLGKFSHEKGNVMENRNIEPPGSVSCGAPGINGKATAGQQEANAALAALAAAGNAFALGQLWEINRGLLRSMFWKWYPNHRELADTHGMTVDDFEQEGYFAVQYTAQTYQPEAGSFSNWLRQAMQRQINQALTGGHRRNVTDADGKQHTVSADPLNHCTSLDVPLDTEDDGAASLGEIQPDPTAAEAFQDVEERIYQKELHAALEEALHKLTQREETIIRGRFYQQKTLQDIAAEERLSFGRVRQVMQNALRTLSRSPRLQRWHDDFINTHAYHYIGQVSFSSGGSIEERILEALECRKLL